MKRFAFLFLLAGGFVPLAFAQDGEHVQVGVFADYLHLSQTDNNFGGFGAGFQAYKEIKLEGEVSYDFGHALTEGFLNTGKGTITFARTNMRLSPRRIWAEG